MQLDKMVDDLGTLNTKIQQLEEQARKIKQALIAHGAGKYSGVEYCAEVQHYDRATISPILVKEFGTSDFVAQVTQVRPVDAVVVRRVTE